MKTRHLLIALALVAAAFTLVACAKKAPAPTAAVTAGTAVATAAPPEENVVATPDAAGAKPVATPKDVAKAQAIDGLGYTIAVVGWDNPFTITMVDRIVANVKTLSAEAAGADKDKYAKAEVDLGGVKAKLDGVVKSNGSLKQEELNALKDTLRSVRAALIGGAAPIPENIGDKMKEGQAEKNKKLDEAGEMKKRKAAEGK